MARIDENNVAAKGQLKPTEFVTFESPENSGVRIMFVGNSITRHGPAPQIGWNHDWGMAASAKEKDYVHLVIEKVRKTRPDAAFCLCQVAEWERKFKEENPPLSLFASGREFAADIIVMRLIENCSFQKDEGESFQKAYEDLIGYLNPAGRAKILLTTGFWKHEKDDAIRAYAEKTGLPLVELGDLGEQDEMMAIGLFEHHGVSIHPGDKGMEQIAERIFDGIENWI